MKLCHEVACDVSSRLRVFYTSHIPCRIARQDRAGSYGACGHGERVGLYIQLVKIVDERRTNLVGVVIARHQSHCCRSDEEACKQFEFHIYPFH